MLESVKAWLEERRRKREAADRAEDLARRQRYALEWDDTEMRVVTVGIECRVEKRARWESIRKVIAYKRDLWHVDQVYIIVEADDCTLQLDEEMAKFWDFQADLPNHLTGAMGMQQFWEQVVSPAFETRLTTLYEANRE